MASGINRLSARQVASLKASGRHADGGGLYLRITPAGTRSWVFMAVADGKRSEIGLGAANAVSLQVARQLATKMREAVAEGSNPRNILRPEPAVQEMPTFSTFAEQFIASVEDGWRNSVHRQQWRNSLRDHAGSLASIPIDQIDTEAVLSALQPIWLTKPETAKRVRGRIEKILDAAKVRGFRPRDSINPASWRGHLALLLPTQSKLPRGHHAALPWKNAPTFMKELRSRPAIAARCLEFTILTAARSGETLGATWAEMDFDAGTWTIPAFRMKAGAEQVVPLSVDAITVLRGLLPSKLVADDAIFGISGAARSNMAMAMLLRRMGYGHITTHGFRSTFRDWAGDATEFPRELIEQALAHTIQNKAERAYRRGTAVDRRRELMQQWANFVGSRADSPPELPINQ